MTLRLRPMHILLTGAIALALAACSSGSVPAATAVPNAAAASAPVAVAVTAAPDAVTAPAAGDPNATCSIVTADAVGTAAGFAVARSSGAGGICSFQNADSSKYLTVQTYSSQADMALMLQAEPAGEHIAGLGDDAFWSQMAGLLFVRKGDHGIAFLDPDLGTVSTDTASRDALEILARAALPKL